MRPDAISAFAMSEEEERLYQTRDYFEMLQCGAVIQHSPESWRSFQSGYRAVGEESRRYERALEAAS